MPLTFKVILYQLLLFGSSLVVGKIPRDFVCDSDRVSVKHNLSPSTKSLPAELFRTAELIMPEFRKFIVVVYERSVANPVSLVVDAYKVVRYAEVRVCELYGLSAPKDSLDMAVL